jgi:phosphoribosylglycinamide formyltransferase-1
VVSDRPCPAIDKARVHGIPATVIHEPDAARFSTALLRFLEERNADYAIAFFTRLFVGELIQRYRDRIINLHPSLLPAFKGLNAFAAALRYGVRFIGTTVHFVDEEMDQGKIILQTSLPLNPDQAESSVRHRIFGQQCKALLQVMRWLAEDRVSISERGVRVSGASFQLSEFCPNLDFEDAIDLDVASMRLSA